MKKILCSFALIGAVHLASAQERVPQETALRYAKLAGADTQQLQGTPIPTSVDLTQPVAMQDGEFGGMVLPQAKLTAEALAKASDKVLPIGQLWLLRLTPMSGGEKVSSDKLRLATVKTPDGEELKVPQCALGVQRSAAGALELLVFGKDKEPLLKVALKAIDEKQTSPLELDAERGDEAAQVHLKILGKYQATFKVTQLDL